MSAELWARLRSEMPGRRRRCRLQARRLQFVSLGRAPPPRVPFIGTPRPSFADGTLCGCRPLADAEATAPTWPNRRPDPWAEGRAEHVGAADATRRRCVTSRRG